MLTETTQNDAHTSVKPRKGLLMCTMTHFAHHSTDHTHHAATPHPVGFQAHVRSLQDLALPRFQVVPAGKAFFHIKETSTGRVRGFRTDHNDACALARALAAHT